MSSSYSPLEPPFRLLMGPGPSPVEPRVYAAMSKPIVGHLDPFFFKVTEEIREMLGLLYGSTSGFNICLSGTGTSGMESAVSNFVEGGSKFAVFANGFFCDRLSEMGRRQGAEVVRFEKPWGEVFGDDEAREFILRERPQTVAFVHAETSTGVLQPGKAICDAAHEVGANVIADCVTSLGTTPIGVAEMGIDIAYSCSQKGLGAPPGLSPVTVSERGLDWLRKRGTLNHSWYLDLKLIDEYYGKSHRYHHTAPISMFYAVREALAVVMEEGIQNRFARHRENHLAFVAGCEAMGLEMYVAKQNRMWPLNTPRVPEGVTDTGVRKHLMDNHGIEILGGFGPLAGKIFRVGIMGAGSKRENVLLLLGAMHDALKAEGYTPAGDGRAAAEALYAAAI